MERSNGFRGVDSNKLVSEVWADVSGAVSLYLMEQPRYHEDKKDKNEIESFRHLV